MRQNDLQQIDYIHQKGAKLWISYKLAYVYIYIINKIWFCVTTTGIQQLTNSMHKKIISQPNALSSRVVVSLANTLLLYMRRFTVLHFSKKPSFLDRTSMTAKFVYTMETQKNPPEVNNIRSLLLIVSSNPLLQICFLFVKKYIH